MFFHEIGSLLKSTREEKGISQEEVASKLRIPLRSIIAIENGVLEELPHEVYVRTFLKGYANYIGFSTEEIRNLFNDIDDFKDKEDPPKSLEAKGAETQPEAIKSKGVQVTIQLLLVALLGTSAYFFYVKNGKSEIFSLNYIQSLFTSDKTTPIQVDKNNQKEDTQNQKILVNINDAKQLDNTANTENARPETTTPQTEIGNTVQENIPQSVNNALNETELPTTPERGDFFDTGEFAIFIAQTPEALAINWNIVSNLNPGQQQAVIYVSQDCWMSAVIDGKSANFTLEAGSQKDFIFNDTLQLKLANASAVTLFHNRKLVEVGDSAALRTINLNAN